MTTRPDRVIVVCSSRELITNLCSSRKRSPPVSVLRASAHHQSLFFAQALITSLCSSRKRSSPCPTARLATLFAQHPDVVDARRGIHGLGHVIERQRRDADGRQCLHLD